MSESSSSGVVVVVPAKDEARRVGATVTAARAIPGVVAVVVVDDGSSDGTSGLAQTAGALVARHRRNRGKAAAMETGADVAAGLAGAAVGALLFLDADLEGTASDAAPLLAPVLGGEADMTIALLPRQELRLGGAEGAVSGSASGDAPAKPGGRGLVVGLARRGIVAATGWQPTQPLSGMRCLSPAAFAAARPLAAGWGVETALTIDLLRAGYRVVEVPCALEHRATGSDWRATRHRAGQYRDVARALLARRVLTGRVLLGRGLLQRGG